MEIKRTKTMFISLNVFTNKDTWDTSYNIDLQHILNEWTDNEFRKIEKIYLPKDISEDNLKKLWQIKGWDYMNFTINLI